MIRKSIFAVGLVTLLGLFLFGRNVKSYVGTATGWARDSVRDSVPVAFEIDRARNMVKDLIPDIRQNMHIIAKEEVEVERLKEQIKQSDQKLNKDRTELKQLKEDVASGKEKYQYGGRTYTVSQVKVDLSNRFERFKTSDATVNSLRDILSAREKSLDAARQKLEGMLAAKRKLEVDVENLEARHKMVEVAQTTSNFTFDDSQLGRVKELVSDLGTRLQVAEKIVNVEGTFNDQIPLDAPVNDNIVDDVAEYLGEKPDLQLAEVKTPAIEAKTTVKE
ncbi:MAG: hypothetical protein SGJ20_21800 [Planctomycetota bacterium]|nr:hypothetical protein [Planctomycetota bacterium]